MKLDTRDRLMQAIGALGVSSMMDSSEAKVNLMEGVRRMIYEAAVKERITLEDNEDYSRIEFGPGTGEEDSGNETAAE